MTTAMSLTGILVLVLLSVAALLASIGYAAEKGKELLLSRDWHARENTAKEIGSKIVNSYHWFSEDVDSMEAVKAVGEQLMHGGYWLDISAARDRWRKVKKGVPVDG